MADDVINTPPVVSDDYAAPELFRECELFLYREARLLDTERWQQWLDEMVDPVIRYYVFSRQLRFRKEKRYAQPDEIAMYDENYEFLRARVSQFYSGNYWRVDPPERYRHIVNNVEAFVTGKADEVRVRSNVFAQRARRAYEVDQFVYCREDVLVRRACGRLKLLSRQIDYDERCVSGRNLVMLL